MKEHETRSTWQRRRAREYRERPQNRSSAVYGDSAGKVCAGPPAASTTGRATTTVTSREPVTFTTPAYTTTTTATSPFLNAAGQVVGYTVEDATGKWLTKRVDTRKHQLRAPMGWASDVRILELCAAQRVDGLRLLDEQGGVWQAPLSAF